MSIIQTIRDKGTAIVIGVIALSLIGFLLMDARSGASKGMFGGSNTTIGSVNGKSIEYEEFASKVKAAEAQYPNTNGGIIQQIRQNVWDQVTGEGVLTSEYNKLGLVFTAKEMSAIMFSEDAPQALKQNFNDPTTGRYDIGKAQQWWAQTKKSKNEEQLAAINSQVIDPMRSGALGNKYVALINGSIYEPSWLTTKLTEENKAFANISYVAIPYSAISDSAVTVTDADIEKYIDNNKAQFKQEEGRMISYVSFSAAPSQKDSLHAKENVLNLKQNFAADTNSKAFIARNTSAINFFDGYSAKAKIQVPNKDSIFALPDGGLFGPYLDASNYVIAKKISTKIFPDSIKCRHILLGTNNPQTGEALMADSIAKKKVDSIQTAIRSGANFDSLEAKYSTDQAAHKDKGVMTFDLNTIQSDNFAKEFAEFLLNDKGETKKAIKTQFGWHYIEILEKKNPGPAYKIAYMAKEIVPSDETINSANSAATRLAGQARDFKAFDAYVKQNGLKKIDVPTAAKENDFNLGGLQDARALIKWAYSAKEGDVSNEPISVGPQYIVPVLTRKISAGVPDAKTARPLVEAVVRNQKKAAEIKKKLNNPTTLEAAAAIFQKQVLQSGADSTLTFNANLINGIGNEAKIAGAAFNKDYQAKVSPPIAGNTGVFVLKVNSIANKPADLPEIAKQQKSQRLTQTMQASVGSSFNALKKIADIKDNRSKFF